MKESQRAESLYKKNNSNKEQRNQNPLIDRIRRKERKRRQDFELGTTGIKEKRRIRKVLRANNVKENLPRR